MAKKAKVGDKLQVHYTGKLDDGSVVETSGGKGYTVFAPFELVLGQECDELPPKVQEALVGMKPGQSTEIKVACEEAFGPRFEEWVFTVNRADLVIEEEVLPEWRYHFHSKKSVGPTDPKPGDRMELSLSDGSCVPAVVTEVTDTAYTFDANHPLAGRDLTYEITLLSIG